MAILTMAATLLAACANAARSPAAPPLAEVRSAVPWWRRLTRTESATTAMAGAVIPLLMTVVVAMPVRPQWVTQVAANPIIPGIGLAGIELGQAESEVIDSLGTPDQGPVPIFSNDGDVLEYALIYRFEGLFLGVYTEPSTRTVRSIRLDDTDFNSSGYVPSVRGVTIGSTLMELTDAFGQPLATHEHATCPLGDPRTTTYEYEGIDFWVCVNDLVYLMGLSGQDDSPAVTPPAR